MKEGRDSDYEKRNISMVIRYRNFNHDDGHKTYEVMFSTQPTTTDYQGNFERNHRFWKTVSTDRCLLHMQVLLNKR
jgi:hypothetical protein